jgi:hypothetical protein
MTVTKTFQICLTKSAKVVRRRFHVPPAKTHEHSVFCKQKLISQKPKQILVIFWNIPKGEAFEYLQQKNQRCIFILSVRFCMRNRNALYFVCAIYFVGWCTISRSKIGAC